MTKNHPYKGLPNYQFWQKEPAIQQAELFDPVITTSFKINQKDAVVTAGSCFAQHVARHLSRSGFNHLISEKSHPMFDKATQRAFHYGMFSARYGNIYTARQLKQLLQRAYGDFSPFETAWVSKGQQSVIDPFRPHIQPGGFVSEAELLLDQQQHFSAIRNAVETMQVFVFTLGLTECWADTRDGAVFPLAPGVAGGIYNPETVKFHNFNQQETTDDLLFALNFIREKNPNVRFILTVSPVSLNATKENRHVFVSTTWSKAILRVSAEEVTQQLEHCDYFPSYEIITSPYSRGQYFAPDCRSVTLAGVEHVMRLFFKHYGDIETGSTSQIAQPSNRNQDQAEQTQKSLDLLCDEEAIKNE